MKMERHVPERRRRGVKGYGGKKWSHRQIIQGIVVLLVWVWAGLFLRGLGWTFFKRFGLDFRHGKRYVINCTSWKSVVQGSDGNRRV